MIEHRVLNKQEVDRIIEEAIPSETKYLRELDTDIFEFFRYYSIVQDGMLVDGRPLYIAALIRNEKGRIQFWTVVNKDNKHIIAMTRLARKQLWNWVDRFGVLYATMEKVSPKNMKWVEWLGFKPIEEDNQYITYRIGD